MTSAMAINACGLVTSVGMHPSSACAAMRCRLNNFKETSFHLGPNAKVLGAAAHGLTFRGIDRLYTMVKDALDQAADSLDPAQRLATPLLLCLSETDRPGRLRNLEDRLTVMIRQAGYGASPYCRVLPLGKVGTAAAFVHARDLLAAGHASHVLIAAADSLLTQQTVSALIDAGRLQGLSDRAGMILGEGAGALLVSPARTSTEEDGPAQAEPKETTHDIWFIGSGFAVDGATLANDEPVRGEGLRAAIVAAMDAANLKSTQIGLRLADLSGERFYFEDAATAMMRLPGDVATAWPLWLPAESVGETGAAAGVIAAAWLHEAALRGYSECKYALCHFANDDGQRAAMLFELHARPRNGVKPPADSPTRGAVT